MSSFSFKPTHIKEKLSSHQGMTLNSFGRRWIQFEHDLSTFFCARWLLTAGLKQMFALPRCQTRDLEWKPTYKSFFLVVRPLPPFPYRLKKVIQPLTTVITLLEQRGCTAQWKHSSFPPSSPEFKSRLCQVFSLYCLVCGTYWDKTHLVLCNGFHKSSLWWRPELSTTKSLIRVQGCPT